MKKMYWLPVPALCAVCCSLCLTASAADDDPFGLAEEEKTGKVEKKLPKTATAPAAEKPDKKMTLAERKHAGEVAIRKKERQQKQERMMAEWMEKNKAYQRAAEIAKARGATPPKAEPAPDFTWPKGKVDPIELYNGYYKGETANKTGKIEVVLQVEKGEIRHVWTSAPDSGVRAATISDLEQQVIRKNCSVIPGVPGQEEFTKHFSDAVEKALKGKALAKKPQIGKKVKRARRSSKH